MTIEEWCVKYTQARFRAVSYLRDLREKQGNAAAWGRLEDEAIGFYMDMWMKAFPRPKS